MASIIASPSIPGLSVTLIPALLIASILASAPPLLPETIAPACPILLPGGAVLPATKPATGFLIFEDFKKCAEGKLDEGKLYRKIDDHMEIIFRG